jgi:hypothetical protein
MSARCGRHRFAPSLVRPRWHGRARVDERAFLGRSGCADRRRRINRMLRATLEDIHNRLVVDAVASLDSADQEWLMNVLRNDQLPAAWELGNALARSWGSSPRAVRARVEAFVANPDALVGYLRGLVEKGDEVAFDQFFESSAATSLDGYARLAISARGPQTSAARTRIMNQAKELPVARAISALFGWQHEFDETEAAELTRDWLERLSGQEDYNALLDWFPVPHGEGDVIPSGLLGVARELVFRRADFPEIRQQQWEWSQLARHFVTDSPVELARLIMDLIDADQLIIHHGDPESQVLLEAMKEEPQAVWEDASRRLLDRSWRLQMEIRGWLLQATPVEVIRDWIGNDVDRARIVASVAPTGGAVLSDVARLLLDRFPGDEEIGSSLWGDFISGVWSGPESARLEQQIEEVRGWQTADASKGVLRWSAEMIKYLQRRLEQVLEQEAERRY